MKKITVIGLGLIGSSICRALKKTGKYTLHGYDFNDAHRTSANEIGFCHKVFDTVNDSVKDSDIIILATPLSAFGDIAKTIMPHLKDGAIITDVGSVKKCVIDTITPHMKDGVHLVPAHPISGTEKSGPNAGYDSLFENRYTIITPIENTPENAIDSIKSMWVDMGSIIDTMTPDKHDKVLAITSHIPHLLAFTLVGTAAGLEDKLLGEMQKTEVIKYSAGGFRDATRVAASDPVVWRDIFLDNKEAILQIIEMFEADLQILKTAIKNSDGDTVLNWCSKTREIRRGVIDMGQANHTDPIGEEIISLMPYSQ